MCQMQVYKVMSYGLWAMQQMQEGPAARHKLLCSLFLETDVALQHKLAEVRVVV